MEVLHPIILTFAILFLTGIKPSDCQRRRARANNPAVASLLKNILTPGSDGLMKLLAANGRTPRLAEEVLPSAVVPRSVLPNAILQQSPQNFVSNGRVVTNPGYQQVFQPNFVEYPAQFEVGQAVMPVGKTVNVEVSPSIPVTENCQPQLPARLVNPFLPAASPVSAIAPTTSSLLPPANINNPRSTFLRKIPIPPPTL